MLLVNGGKVVVRHGYNNHEWANTKVMISCEI